MKNVIKKLKNNKKYLKLIIVILFLSFLILNFVNSVYKEHLKNDMTIIFPQGEVNVQIANTDSAKKIGLSYRKEIFEKEGMLFAFDKSDNYSFWMKDMNFPIDIIWISSDKRIVHIEDEVATSTYPKLFRNNPKALYVLEIKAGTRKKLGAFLGSEVKFEILN